MNHLSLISLFYFFSLYCNAQVTCFYANSYKGVVQNFYDPQVALDHQGNVYNVVSEDSLRKIDANGATLWARKIPSYCRIASDKQGNVYLAGTFTNTFDFDPGPSLVQLSAGIFIWKLDAAGSFVWAKSVAGVFSPVFSLDVRNNHFCLYGNLGKDTVDINPGKGVTQISGKGQWSYFICRFDLSCNLQWTGVIDDANNLDGNWSELRPQAVLDDSGNVYVTGEFSKITDFDPTNNVHHMPPYTGYYPFTDGQFVLKLDTDGKFSWVHGFPTTQIFGIGIDSQSDVYISICYNKVADVDPGPATYNLFTPAFASRNMAVVKWDGQSKFKWARNFGDGNNLYWPHLAIDLNDNIYASGMVGQQYPAPVSDWDKSNATWHFQGGDQVHFFTKFNKNGDFQWAKFLSGSISCFRADNHFIYATGLYKGGDINPDPILAHQIATGYNQVVPYVIKFGAHAAKTTSVSHVQCHGAATGQITVTAVGEGVAFTYSWLASAPKGIPNFSLVANSSSVLSNAKSGIYDAIVTDDIGCIYYAYLLKSLHSAYIAEPQKPVTYSLNTINESCIGGGFNGSATISEISGGTSPYKCSWSSSPTHTLNTLSSLSAGSYTVSVFDAKGCETKAPVVIQKDPNPSAYTFTTSGLNVNFSVSAGCNNFEWNFGNNTGSNTQKELVMSYEAPGTYTVCLTCNNLPYSCAQCINITLPSNFAGGVGIEEIQNAGQFNIFPNPGTGRFTIEISQQAEDAEVIIFDAVGRIVLTASVTSTTNIDLDLNPGIYLFQLRNVSVYKVKKVTVR